MKSIGVLAGDLRQHYISLHLKKSGYNCEYLYNLKKKDIYITSIPFSKDNNSLNTMTKSIIPVDEFISFIETTSTVYTGYLSDEIRNKFSKSNIKYIDLMNNQEIITYNSYLTAEGLLSKVISTVPFSLKECNILVLGCGNCGFNIIKVFENMVNHVFIYDINNSLYKNISAEKIYSKETIKQYLNNIKIIINTVPACILNDKDYNFIPNDAFIFDITSFPNAFNQNLINKHNQNLITCPGIPGNYSPESAGGLLAKKIIKHLEGNDLNDMDI
ncbi:MAG: hypothetical protein E7254_04025 [Lachnospiraceae bacterium]|nr:hypothetical protein [Lachnospiraceae bacterium]